LSARTPQTITYSTGPQTASEVSANSSKLRPSAASKNSSASFLVLAGVVTGFFTKTNAGWTYDSQHGLHKIAVKLDTNGTEVYAARTKSGRQYRRAVETDVPRNEFPLKLGYAITGHKSQGATISGKCALDVRTAFAPGLLYVMLTRVTNRANLFLLRRLMPDNFEPGPLKFQI
jgi:hypothetical protein